MAQQAAPAEAEADVPTVETWSDKDQRIVVTQPAAGVLYDLILRAKIDGTPEEVYDVLRDPNSHEIFRGIKATLSRTTLEDDGAGRRKLLVVHRALTRFLWLSVTFDTQLYVWEDDVARSIRFTNARSDGFMRQFEGTWHVQPFTQSTLDAIFRQCGQQQGQAQGTLGHAHAQQQQQQAAVQQQQQRHGWLSPAGALSALSQRLHAGHAASSGASSDSATALVTLEQALAPRARPPGPVAHLVRGLCARVLHNMMADLRTEVARRQALATGLLEGAGDDTNEQQQHSSSSSKAVQQRRPPSLPVASLTCSSGSSGTGQAARSSSSSSSSGGLQQQLADLLAAAVPLAITVQL